jgi:hypothetical protein
LLIVVYLVPNSWVVENFLERGEKKEVTINFKKRDIKFVKKLHIDSGWSINKTKANERLLANN